jgi:23S rRNA (cytosine1962-C5)-methyltransferase
MTRPAVHLTSRGEAPARARHPWIFSGAVAEVIGDPEPGAEVDILTRGGEFLGRGFFNPHSQIRVRLYTPRDEALDASFFASRVRRAVELRRELLGLNDPAGACRLVFSEADGLSGLTVDRYGAYLAVQLTGLGIANRLDPILDALDEMLSPTAVVLRTEKGVGKQEGLILEDGPLRGDAPPAPIEIEEGPLRFLVDLGTGQKTGFYLDQRSNRQRAATFAAGRTVADVCSYSGGFSIAAAHAGAEHVTAVDVSASALELARANASLNGVGERVETVRGDAFDWLTEQSVAGRAYGLIIVDPPRFARTRRGIPSALEAYERLNRLAVECLEPGGILVTFSCSGRVPESDFAAAVCRGAAATGRPVRILERLAQAADHPVSVTCPESAYLNGLLCVAE